MNNKHLFIWIHAYEVYTRVVSVQENPIPSKAEDNLMV